MRVTEVILSKRWKHCKTGQTASVYGSVPWTNDADKFNWDLENVGWTWKCSDGTIGLGRQPVSTQKEAIEIMNKVNAL